MFIKRKRKKLDSFSVFIRDYHKHTHKLQKECSGIWQVVIELDPDFLEVCEDRIIEGRQKYGDDWKYKDCLKEQMCEVYDHFNYAVLDRMQKEYKKKHTRKYAK